MTNNETTVETTKENDEENYEKNRERKNTKIAKRFVLERTLYTHFVVGMKYLCT